LDARLCREHLARLLRDETTALAELEVQLDSEYAALSKRDITALEEASDARAWQMTRLVKLEDERRSACTLYGYPPTLQGMAALLDWCDPARTLADSYHECVTRALRCRDYNNRNASLVNARMTRIESMLGALSSDVAPARIYGRDGAARANAAGRLLSAEA